MEFFFTRKFLENTHVLIIFRQFENIFFQIFGSLDQDVGVFFVI